jgi:hypothetical protein
MELTTLIIAVIASLVVFMFRPTVGIIAYVAVIAFYPSNVTVQIGTIDFSAGRIVILALYAKLFFATSLPRNFKMVWMDKLIIVFFIAQLAAGAVNVPMSRLLENRAGAVCDLVLPYFAARMIITRKEDLILLLKGVMVMAIPLAALGLYQSVTGDNPLGGLRAYASWGATQANQSAQRRYGFYRATVTFPQPIMFGLFFAMFGPICVGLYHYCKKNLLYPVGIAAMGIGAWCCMSSGPIFAAGLAAMFIVLYRYRQHWKTLLAIVIVMCATVEIISNRHFWEVIDRFTYSGSTAWYRGRLIQVALFEGGMRNHWLTGYGYRDPNWGPRLDGRSYSDVVNHYLVILCRYGLVGLIPFLIIIFVAAKRLVQAWKFNHPPRDMWLLWCFAGAMFGNLLAMNTVMLFGPPRTIFYLMLALSVAIPAILVRDNVVVPAILRQRAALRAQQQTQQPAVPAFAT